MRIFLLFILLSLPAIPSKAENIGYVSMEPEIVTNYITESASKIGFVRMSIDLMTEDVEFIPMVESHLPLLRATVIEILGQHQAYKVKSLTGREEIRLQIKKELNALLELETGAPRIKEVLLTKYLYQ
ncbi:flagellar basal body-associated FliL family protein [Opacimonas viscosa]|jgi:flagellar FliL protein|uniref:Flagellar protein FliL n=1 Tax=Opacimonas viscosa TaxID=2961944 RepID=A0AA41X5L7_9ALTE|nr:flagellar basal body-associated FliL family protein [Opacimonas viscosa]MCP3429044.1 flagellar basal body-associated protein FliL [Opacimonas viscosa]